MDLKEEYNLLVETVKNSAAKKGHRLTNTAISGKLKMHRTHFAGLLSGKEQISEKHIEDFKLRFKNELLEASGKKKHNPQRAFFTAILEEVAFLSSEKRKVSQKEAKALILKRARTILDGLESGSEIDDLLNDSADV